MRDLIRASNEGKEEGSRRLNEGKNESKFGKRKGRR